MSSQVLTHLLEEVVSLCGIERSGGSFEISFHVIQVHGMTNMSLD